MRNGSGIERDEGSRGFAADRAFQYVPQMLSTRSAHSGFRPLAFDLLTPARLLNFDRAQPSANRGQKRRRSAGVSFGTVMRAYEAVTKLCRPLRDPDEISRLTELSVLASMLG